MARAFHRSRFRRFGPRQRAAAVKVSNMVAKRRTRCAACLQVINKGDPYVRLRLRKKFRAPCGSCGQPPKGTRRYHPPCVPVDHNQAMGYDPNAPITGANPVPPPSPATHAVPPPPKPPTATEAALAALVSLEAAVIAKAKTRGITPEMEAAFKKFQGIKARVLRPGTPAEGEVATYLAIQHVVKMVFQ